MKLHSNYRRKRRTRRLMYEEPVLSRVPDPVKEIIKRVLPIVSLLWQIRYVLNTFLKALSSAPLV